MRKRKNAKVAIIRGKTTRLKQEAEASVEAVRSRLKEAFALPAEERAGTVPDLIDVLKSLAPRMAAELMTEAARTWQEEALPMLESLAGDTDPDYAAAAVEALGFVRSPRSAALLVSIERAPGPKSIRKSARRAIHRLRSQGVLVQEEPPAAEPEAGVPGRRIIRSVLGSVDGVGGQVVGLLVSAPLRGTTSVLVLVEDTAGIGDMGVAPMRKREFDEYLKSMEQETFTFVDAPAPYVLFRVREAEARSREKGTAIPADYHVYRDLFYMPGPEYERPLVYEEIDAEEVRSDPSLLDKSGELLEVPEFSTWSIEPERAMNYAAQVIQAEESPIVLSEAAKQERIERIFRTAIDETFTSEVRALYKRRLEENAYVLLRTERAAQARIALATALALSPDGPPAERIPFAQELVRRSVAATIHEEERERRIHIVR